MVRRAVQEISMAIWEIEHEKYIMIYDAIHPPIKNPACARREGQS
jgi:hypothetical protein